MQTLSLSRVLEPEVMDSVEEANDYDSMDHSTVNIRFVDDLLVHQPNLTSVLDVGTGTARIPIELANRVRDAHVLAIDLAQSMLDLGQKNVDAAGLSDRVKLELVDAKNLGSRRFSCVMSNSIVHHIPNPERVLEQMVRVLAGGGLLFVRDLARPATSDEVNNLVERYAGQENERQKMLFDASLRAALTLGEVVEMVRALGIPASAVSMTSDRHWTVCWRAQ